MAPLNPNAPPFNPSSNPHHHLSIPPHFYYSYPIYSYPSNPPSFTFSIYYPPPQKLVNFPDKDSTLPPLVEETKEMIKELNKEEENIAYRVKSCSRFGGVRRNIRKMLSFPLRSTPAATTVNFEFKDDQGGGGNKTTVMLKNIPNKFDKQRVLQLLDEHCLQVNKNLSVADAAQLSEFDFLYLPIDFSSGSNMGYAFINFTTPTAARRFFHEFHCKKSWAHVHSSKVCEVTYARIQGVSELLNHFKNSRFFCEDVEYLPVHFRPCRNGWNRRIRQRYIGVHVPTVPIAE